MPPQPPLLPLLLLACAVAAAGSAAAAAAEEVSLPLGELRHKPPPHGYVALKCSSDVRLDGQLDDSCWQAAPWTQDFVDIVGPSGPAPWLRTRAKMLWSERQGLLIGAELEEPRAFAHERLHDSVIFHDNDFEVFIDPDGDNWHYVELEVNAAGTVWDLLLARPYRNGGPPVMSFETIQPRVPTQLTGPTGWRHASFAVSVQGSLNSAAGSSSWKVEIAIPWSLLAQVSQRQTPPAPGDQWRINFSRVEYNVSWDEQQRRYVKDPPEQPGYNWVWTPQWQVAMHQPETWGWVQFAATEAGAPPACASAAFVPDASWPARALLMDVYHAQTLCWQASRRFCASLAEMNVSVSADTAARTRVETTSVSFVASSSVDLGSGRLTVVLVDQTGRLAQHTLDVDGQPWPPGAAGFNPFDGSSVWLPGAAQETQARAQ